MAGAYQTNYGTTMLLSQDGALFLDTRRVLWFTKERAKWDFDDEFGGNEEVTTIYAHPGLSKAIKLAQYRSEAAGNAAFRSLTTAIMDNSIGGFHWLPDEQIENNPFKEG